MPFYDEHTFQKRLDAAKNAKKGLLEKFKDRPSLDDPIVQAKHQERKAILEARAVRAIEKEKRKKEKLAAEEALRLKLEAEREAQRLKAQEEAAALERLEQAKETERLAEQLRLEVEQKAKRDARYAARKARGKRLPPGKI